MFCRQYYEFYKKIEKYEIQLKNKQSLFRYTNVLYSRENMN